MHNRARSGEMYRHAEYNDVPAEVAAELRVALSRATDAGIRRESIILDPGIGFAKRPRHSFAVLAHLGALAALDRPILSGPSRKSFLKEALGERAPSAREWGTAAAVAASVLLGSHIVRVHGVREMVDVVRVADAIRRGADPSPAA
jgi:dihydropteroate synthase